MRPHLDLCWLAVLLLLLRGDSHCSAAEASDVKRLLGGSRGRRSLLYPAPGHSETKVQVLFGLGLPMEEEASMTLGYVVKCNYNLPYNASHSTGSAGEQRRRRRQLSGGGSRWGLYRMLEAALGKSCLLRAVCEAAELPLASTRHGLLGRLVQLALTPSATREDYELYADREYRAAEAGGRGGDCSRFRQGCSYSPLDYFTRILSAR